MKELHKDLQDNKRNLAILQQQFDLNKELFLNTYEVLAELLAWYHTHRLELDQNLNVETSVILNDILIKAKMIASKAVIL